MSSRFAVPTIVAVASAALLLLAGCSSPASAAEGTWGEDHPGRPHLVLAGDGALSGSDGCNRLIGSWEQDGEAVRFIGVGSTMMACPDVDDWLAALDSAVLEGDSLRVRDATGDEIGVLRRAAD